MKRLGSINTLFYEDAHTDAPSDRSIRDLQAMVRDQNLVRGPKSRPKMRLARFMQVTYAINLLLVEARITTRLANNLVETALHMWDRDRTP